VTGGEKPAILNGELFTQIAFMSDSASGQGWNDNLPSGYIIIIRSNNIPKSNRRGERRCAVKELGVTE
jgi:hypothetical protein